MTVSALAASVPSISMSQVGAAPASLTVNERVMVSASLVRVVTALLEAIETGSRVGWVLSRSQRRMRLR